MLKTAEELAHQMGPAMGGYLRAGSARSRGWVSLGVGAIKGSWRN